MTDLKFSVTAFSCISLLILYKGQSNDITGMEQVVEAMKTKGFEPDMNTQAIIARHYAFAGLKEKALEVMKEMEGDNLDRWVCKFMLPIYASLGEDDEVERFWKVCESNPRVDECKAAILAWGTLESPALPYSDMQTNSV